MPPDMHIEPHAPPGRAAARRPRQSRLLKAKVGAPELGVFDITIRNISASGIGARAPFALTPGQRLTLHLPDQTPTRGTVRWVHGNGFGFETDKPIDLENLRNARGGLLPDTHSKIEFDIIPPVVADHRRPTLTIGAASRGDTCTSDWTSD